MIKKILGAIVTVAVLILAGCKQDTDNTKLNPYLYDYAPLNVGHSVIYDVDSISYNYLTGGTQTITDNYYQIQETIVDTFYFQSPYVNSRLYIYKRTDTTQPFGSAIQEWYEFDQKSTFEDVENDLHFVKLVFPPITGLTWQGNSYLPTSDTIRDTYYPYYNWTYNYTSVNVPATINNLHFDSTLTVLQDSARNDVDDAVSVESYARHVGLIYKKWEVLNKQDPTSTWDNPNMTTGFRIIMKVHSYTL